MRPDCYGNVVNEFYDGISRSNDLSPFLYGIQNRASVPRVFRARMCWAKIAQGGLFATGNFLDIETLAAHSKAT